MSEKTPLRERRYFSKAAAVLMLGAGALTACSTAVEATPTTQKQPVTIESPAPTTSPQESLGSYLDEVLQPTETAPRSPKNDTSRCIFAASQAAVLQFMHDPSTQVNHKSESLTTYMSGIESDNTYSIVVDTSQAGSADISFDATVASQISLRGEMTISIDGSVDESLATVDPNKLRQEYTLAERSGVFNLETGRGETIGNTFSDTVSTENCQTVATYMDLLSE